MKSDDRLKAIIATFPERFGLRAFPGETFRIGFDQSYWPKPDSVVPQLYTQRLVDDQWLDFAKGTPDELRKQLAKLPTAHARWDDPSDPHFDCVKDGEPS